MYDDTFNRWHAGRVLRQPRKSPRDILLSALESALRLSASQISRSCFTTCMSARRLKRITCARGRSFANNDAYRSLHMQMTKDLLAFLLAARLVKFSNGEFARYYKCGVNHV